MRSRLSHSTPPAGAAAALVAVALAATLLPAPAAADDVHLKNGRVFEDVLTVVDEDAVTIELAFGSMRVPLETVARIERSESSLAGYQQRRAALLAAESAVAADWIELAHWAWRAGNRHGAREAALHAAELDPAAEGLAELMPRFDLVFEPRQGRWITLEESLQLQGYRQIDGRWLSPEQQLARAQAAAEASRAREAERESRLTNAVLAMAAAQLARDAESRQPEVVYEWPIGVWTNPFVWRHPDHHRPGHHDPGHHDPGHHRPSPYRNDATAIPMERRQPGSLFPIAPSQGSVGHGSWLPGGPAGSPGSSGSGVSGGGGAAANTGSASGGR